MLPCPSCGYEQAAGAWPCRQCGRVPDASRWALVVAPAAPALAMPAPAPTSAAVASIAEPAPELPAVAPQRPPAPVGASGPVAHPTPATRTGAPLTARGQPRSLEPRARRKGADFLAGIGLGLLPLLIVSITLAASSRLSAVSPAHVYLAGFALAALGWLATIFAMVVLLTRRRLRFIAYGLLTVIVALPVMGAALWMLVLLAAMRG